MLTKTLLAAAALAAVMAGPAHADVTSNGPGLVVQGISLNGTKFNGIRLNGPGLVLQGISLNGLTFNGIRWNGPLLQGPEFNGATLNRSGLNVGGHHGVGLNGQVIAIEF